MRRRMLAAFEPAEREPDPRGARRWLHLRRRRRRADRRRARRHARRDRATHAAPRVPPHRRRTSAEVHLIEAGSRCCRPIREAVAASARRQLETLGVACTPARPSRASTGDGCRSRRRAARRRARCSGPPACRLAARRATLAGRPRPRRAACPVARRPELPGHPEIFVVGDLARVVHGDGHAGPRRRPGREADGRARRPRDPCAPGGRPSAAPFRYRDYGNLATIGRKAAVVDSGRCA